MVTFQNTKVKIGEQRAKKNTRKAVRNEKETKADEMDEENVQKKAARSGFGIPWWNHRRT